MTRSYVQNEVQHIDSPAGSLPPELPPSSDEGQDLYGHRGTPDHDCAQCTTKLQTEVTIPPSSDDEEYHHSSPPIHPTRFPSSSPSPSYDINEKKPSSLPSHDTNEEKPSYGDPISEQQIIEGDRLDRLEIVLTKHLCHLTKRLKEAESQRTKDHEDFRAFIVESHNLILEAMDDFHKSTSTKLLRSVNPIGPQPQPP
ncbi:hypothetical protein BGX38DRAFT_781137 [Terfezia claveryi]|nr:hypothetical protein BGX38DRAFT_781137 [Terfezia claveryi]